MSVDTSPALASELQSLLASDATDIASEHGYDAFDEDDPLAWFPEQDLSSEWESICASKKAKKEYENAIKELPLEITPSEFTAFAFRMPKQHGYGYERFSFEGRRHMFAIYNTSAPRVLLCCARQTEKSTTLGNITLNYSCLIPAFKTLYVSPSAMQTKVFSNDRIKEPIETSPVLKTFTNRVLAQNVFEKQFINRSKVTLRYSFLNADRCVVGSTRVYLEGGEVATIQHIFENRQKYLGKMVYAVDPKVQLLTTAAITDAVDQGDREVFTVVLYDGTRLVCTGNQPLLTKAGWQPLDSLGVGDVVAVPACMPYGSGALDMNTPFLCNRAQTINYLRQLLDNRITCFEAMPGQFELMCTLSSREEAAEAKQLLLRFGVQSQIFGLCLSIAGDPEVTTVCDALQLDFARAHGIESKPHIAKHVAWVPIDKVIPSGIQRTFDLSIDRVNNYVSDGIFVHNTRGIPAFMLLLDEIQDLLAENIPVIERCTDHAPDHYKRFIYSGTPKSLDNTIENYRSRFARQGEWVVPCERCGGGDYKYWNILGEQNIGKHGLICAKCGQLINPQHPEAQWAFMVDDAPFESYRVNGLMVPWKKWSEIIFDYETNSRAKFFNEVLGLSYDSGTRPLTLRQVRNCCKEHISMHPKDLRKYYTAGYDKPVFMGIDYGCYSEDTRTLTENGWKYHWEIKEGERIAQYDPHTEEISYVVPMRKIVFEHVGNMVHFKTNNQDLLVTPDHKMFYRENDDQWQEGQAQELLDKRCVKFRKVGNWKGCTPTHVTPFGAINIPTELWMLFLGILVMYGRVGTYRSGFGHIDVTLRNAPEYLDQYVTSVMSSVSKYLIFARMDKNTCRTWRFYQDDLYLWFIGHVGKKPWDRRIPREYMSYGPDALRPLFELFASLQTSIETICHYTRSATLAGDVAELAIKLGYRAIWGTHVEATPTQRAIYKTQVLYNNEVSMSADKITLEPYSGKAYCFSVPSGYFVTERNGRVSFQGNTGENSYTIITIGTYVDSKFRIIYMERCLGEMMEPERQVEHIIELANRYKVTRIGADYGGGFDRNDKLMRTFGTTRLIKFQYMARAKKKIEWDPRLLRFKVQRTEVMSDIFNAIKRNQFEFPRWAEFENPFAIDMLNIFSEYNEQLRQIQYKHSPDKPDDSFHSLLYCFLASMTVIPRPDVIAPRRQINQEQAIFGNPYTGPTNQGRETIW